MGLGGVGAQTPGASTHPAGKTQVTVKPDMRDPRPVFLLSPESHFPNEKQHPLPPAWGSRPHLSKVTFRDQADGRRTGTAAGLRTAQSLRPGHTTMSAVGATGK